MSTPGPSPALAAASEPWAFSQEHPLTTSDLCKEAQRRGIELREEQLPDLWRVGALAPLVEIRGRPLHETCVPAIAEPVRTAGYLLDLRLARNEGRLADAESLGFRPQLRFWRPAPPDPRRHWWNGLLYSRWQVVALHEIRHLLDQGRWRRGDLRLRWRSRELDDISRFHAARGRQGAVVLVALEARYMPTIERAWVSLSNADVAEWEAFVEWFDPAAVLARISTTADDLLHLADDLLLGMHRVDPLGHDWSELIRRAPRRTWDDLSGGALVAMDRRVAAEILLRCYEDLAERGACPPLDERSDLFHSKDERLSWRRQTLDANLSSLGISPHPGVVVVVEGETEEVLVPLVRDHIRIPNQAEVIQSVVLRGATRDLTKLAAFACAPMIDRPQGNDWLLVKPPTRLMVVVDPDPPFDTPQGVEEERQKIINEIVAVVRAQGVDPVRGDVDSLVTVTTWEERCFEFAHFEDEELADALIEVHPHHGGLDRDALLLALAAQRAAGQDIKKVWANWRPSKPSKKDLAHAMWPVLRGKLDAASDGGSVPPLAGALVDAFHEAMRRPRGHFILRGSAVVRG